MHAFHHFAQRQPSIRAFLGVLLSALIILYATKDWITQKSTTQSGAWGDTVYLEPSQRVMVLPLLSPSRIRSTYLHRSRERDGMCPGPTVNKSVLCSFHISILLISQTAL